MTTGPARWLYTACGLMAIAILYADSLFLRLLTQRSLGWETWGRLVQATVLPYATWLILLAMLLLALATRADAAPSHGEEAATVGRSKGPYPPRRCNWMTIDCVRDAIPKIGDSAPTMR